MTALEVAVRELVARVTGPQESAYTCPFDGCLILPLVDRACPVCGTEVREAATSGEEASKA